MPRNGEPARQRLQQAALRLFCERGYDQTTTAEIAARANVTERTFFRHFPDKREVLFDGQAKLREALTSAIAKAPRSVKPMEILYEAFRSVVPPIEANRLFSIPRQQVIDNTPALQERELAKVAALAEALALSLSQRGVDEGIAALASHTGMATFRYAVGSWFADPAGGLGTHLNRAFEELDGLASSLSRRKVKVRRYR
jgi:AcrR family transcriptional regulator